MKQSEVNDSLMRLWQMVDESMNIIWNYLNKIEFSVTNHFTKNLT